MAPTNEERSGNADGNELNTGTTIVGLTAAKGLILASDQRASLGTMVSSKHMEKVVPIHDQAAAAFSGSVSGMQTLRETVAAEARLYETRRGREMNMTALASLIATHMRETEFGVMPIIGGVDGNGAALYEFGPTGGVMEQPYAAGGSGGPYAYGYLETAYEADIPVEKARTIAARAVATASERDVASGNGLCLGVVTEDGVEIETRDSVDPDQSLA